MEYSPHEVIALLVNEIKNKWNIDDEKLIQNSIYKIKMELGIKHELYDKLAFY